jgi:hypothetical protein
VRPENLVTLGREVVGVVLHEGGAAGEAGAHDLHGAQEGGGLPVALGAEAVAVGHEALAGETGELAEAVEVLEGGGEALELALLEEGAHAELVAGGIAEGVVAGAALLEGGGRPCRFLVLGAEGVDVGVLDLGDDGDEVADSVAVGGEAELHLGGDLGRPRCGDLAHVVAEAGELGAPAVVQGGRRASRRRGGPGLPDRTSGRRRPCGRGACGCG